MEQNALVEQPRLSQVERVVDVFVAPTRTFRDILRSRSWWLPFVLLALFSGVSTWSIQRQVGFARVSENMLHGMPAIEQRLSALSPEQRAAQMQAMTVRNRYSTYAFPVSLLAANALYALLLWAGFNFGLGASTRYAGVFTTVIYASLPYLFTSLLLIITLFASPDSSTFNLQNPVGTNPGYYLTDAAPWLRALLARLDLVQLWSIALTVIGMAVLSGKSYAQSAGIVLGLWTLTTALAVGSAALFS